MLGEPLVKSTGLSTASRMFKTIGSYFMLCVHREMKHLGSLESTEEARVALGYATSNSYTLLSCSPNFQRVSITRYTHAKREPIK